MEEIEREANRSESEQKKELMGRERQRIMSKLVRKSRGQK